MMRTAILAVMCFALVSLSACRNERLDRLEKENAELKAQAAKNAAATADSPAGQCIKVFIAMQTIPSDEEPGGKLFVSYLQDALAKSFKTTPCLEYGGVVDDVNDWQMRNAPNEALIELSTGTIDDDSIGVVGKRIEAISYVMYVWQNKRNRTISLGPAMITFGIGDLKATDAIAHQRAMQTASLMSMMVPRNQK